MKFRAVMQDPQYMREFHYIVLTLAKLTKECVMSISADKVHFIANEESGTSAPLVWVDIDAKLYFSEYTMEGVDEPNPHIMLTVSAANLGRALAMLRGNARYCKFKLANIQFPCLSIEVDSVSQSSDQARQVVHDVPVTVISRADWPVYALPTIPACKLVVNVPSNRKVRGLIEKIKNLSPTIIFYATSNGEMNLVAETEMATVTMRYKNLEVCDVNPSEADKSKEVIEASCSVDCKKTAHFFSALQVATQELSCGIDQEHLIHMEVNVRQGVTIHSILPAVCA